MRCGDHRWNDRSHVILANPQVVLSVMLVAEGVDGAEPDSQHDANLTYYNIIRAVEWAVSAVVRTWNQ